MSVREKFLMALNDFEDVNLRSEAAKQALIDRIINIVQNESSDPKYWNITVPPHVRWEESQK
jgi:broad specificity polyphosphatase/5'/3'-nucleotidase SurE